MARLAIAYVATLAAFCILYFLWLGIAAKSYYQARIGSLLLDNPRWAAAFAFYVLFAAGIVLFAVAPALVADSWRRALVRSGMKNRRHRTCGNCGFRDGRAGGRPVIGLPLAAERGPALVAVTATTEEAMRMRKFAMGITAGVAVMCATGVAAAAPCFIIIDRNDVIVYRDIESPVDLSSAGAVDRAALRQRGQHLLIAEFENCYSVGYISPVTGFTSVSVDEIVTTMRPAMSPAVGSSRGGTVTAGAPGSGGVGGRAASASGSSLRSSVGAKVGAAAGKRGY